eukprot:s765_g1.t1
MESSFLFLKHLKLEILVILLVFLNLRVRHSIGRHHQESNFGSLTKAELWKAFFAKRQVYKKPLEGGALSEARDVSGRGSGGGHLNLQTMAPGEMV